MTKSKSAAKGLNLAECLASLGFNFPGNERELAWFEASNDEQIAKDLDLAVDPFRIVSRSKAEEMGKMVSLYPSMYGQVAVRTESSPLPALPDRILKLWKKDQNH
jgi:hypothetical protein